LLEERLSRLDAIRATVSIEVERDPERLLAPTIASAAQPQPGTIQIQISINIFN
jgi:hypothetical protein